MGLIEVALLHTGIVPDLLTDLGDIAAMIRIAHGAKAGLKITPTE